MNINRHNYETFFLLYVDGELSPAERAAVDLFVEEHVDLREELRMLQQVVLDDEPGLTCLDKQSLYKTAPGITADNYEAFFLLYVDGELTPTEHEAVEKFVLQHPALQQAFTLLRQTKLQPEVISFGDKQKLYRTADQGKRPVYLPWLRMASAAALLGFVVMLWISRQPGSDATVLPGKLVGVSDRGAQQKAKPGKLSANEEVLAGDVGKLRNTKETTIKATQNVTGITKQTKRKVLEKMPETKMVEQDIALAAQDKKATSPVDNKNNIPEMVINKRTYDQNGVTLAGTNADDQTEIRQTVYRETNTGEEDDDRTILIGGAEINKNKLRGLFKKAANIFDKKARRDDKDYTIQVANFEIKTK